jgi:predicted dehydrogenase
VVIGLGQVGSRFDEEQRGSVWSHVGAYLSDPKRFALMGGADVNAENRERFLQRCPNAEVFVDAIEAVGSLKPDLISLCTPPQGRADLVEALLDTHVPKVLIVEKPVDVDSESRHRLIETVRKAGCSVIVNYNRRFYPACYCAKAAMNTGEIGRVRTITIRFPNRLWSMGSHAMNLLLYLAGAVPEHSERLRLPDFDQLGEPAADMLCRFENGMAGRLLCDGDRGMLYFEADIVGERGRIRIDRNGERSRLERFEGKPGWAGYRELGEPEILAQNPNDFSSFIEMTSAALKLMNVTRALQDDLIESVAGEDLLEWLASSLASSSDRNKKPC